MKHGFSHHEIDLGADHIEQVTPLAFILDPLKPDVQPKKKAKNEGNNKNKQKARLYVIQSGGIGRVLIEGHPFLSTLIVVFPFDFVLL